MANPTIYTVGGTVQAGGGIYIPRQADDELLGLCRSGTFAYVLTPRQMGKSSLMVRTAQRLTDEEIRSVIVDLQELGANVTAEQWYFGFLVKLDDQLMFDTDVVNWWQEHEHLGVSQRLTQFFEKILLAEVEGQVVIFVDEIDSTLSLDFTDDFFIAIRYLYVARATNAEFNRLSFVLMGVATPGDLISDAKRTPFNIGQRVDLTDFTFEEALPLAEGLGLPSDEAKQILHQVLKWTGGHPYLTQRLCGALVAERHNKFVETRFMSQRLAGVPTPLASSRETRPTQWLPVVATGVASVLRSKDVGTIVNSTFFGVMSEQDNNLQFVRDMLTKRAPDPEVLTIYREIRWGKRAVVDEEQSLAKSHLKLSGVVRRENNVLRVRNQIYQQVFDYKWINKHLPFNLRDRWERLKPALPYVIVMIVFSTLSTAVAWYIYEQNLIAQKALEEANKRRINAEILAKSLELQNLMAEKSEFDAFVASLKVGKRLKTPNKNVEQDTRMLALPTLKQAILPILKQAIYKFKERNRIQDHNHSVRGVVFSPDGQTIASVSHDKTVKLWNLKGQVLQTLTGHSYWISGVAFSPDGQTIASVSHDKTVKLWNLKGQVLQTLTGHSDSVRGVAFSPDGQTITSVSDDKTVKLWNLKGQVLQTLTGHSDSVRSVAFSPNGQIIASASRDKTVKLWNRNGKVLQTLTGHSDSVRGVAFSPDGQIIASGSDDKTVKLWNLKGQMLQTLTGHNDLVNTVAFSPDGQIVASSSDDKTVKLWNLKGQMLQTLIGHSDLVNSVVFRPDGQTIASGSDDKTVRLWNRNRQKVLPTLPGHTSSVNNVAFSPDGQTIASVSDDKTVRLWDRKGKVLQILTGHSDSVRGVAFSPDGQTIASASDDKTVRLWNRNGKVLQILTGHSDSVRGVAFSLDGQIIASASRDKTVKLWNRNGKVLQTLTGHSDLVNTVAFSPDSQIIASASRDKTVKLWNRNGKVLQTLTGHSDLVWGAAFSPDGQIIASASSDKMVKLWNRNGKVLQTLQDHRDWVWGVAFSPDGRTIASASLDDTVKLWNRNGQVLQTLQSHNSSVYGVAFSPDNQTIASASHDKTVKLWNRNGQLLQTLAIGHSKSVRGMTSGDDGQIIASTSLDKTDLDDLMVKGCAWVRDYLQNNPNVNESDKRLCDDVGIGR
jgi:WD40 repeat protein